MAEQRLFAEGVDRDPPEVVAAGAGELAEVLLRAGWGTAMSELENWSQARPPTAIAAPIASSAADQRDSLRAAPGSARARTRLPGQLPAPALEPPQAGEEQQGQGDPGEQDQQHRHALVDGRLVGEVVGEAAPRLHGEHRRQRRRAPRSPASPAARAGRGRGRAGSRRATSSDEQAAARVGEVEGEQDRRHRRDREPAQRRPARAAAHPQQQRDRDPEHRPVRVPVAERVAQPRARCRASCSTSSTWGRRRLPRPRRATSVTAIARPSAKRWRLSSVWAIRNAARKKPR